MDPQESSSVDPGTAPSKKDSAAIDFQNPLFIHPSDTPNLDLVSEVLRGSDNYNVWSREVIVALEAKNKIGLIDGSCQEPDQNSLEYPYWRRCNALVRSWIHKSLSRELIHGVVYCESARSIWLDLKERFDRVNGARLYSLYRKINTITQGTNTVSDYYSQLRVLWDEYDSLTPSPSKTVSKEYSDFTSQLKMMQFLMGLNESYSNVRSQILLMSPLPSHNQVYSMVSNEETQKGIVVQTSDSTIALLGNSYQQHKGKGIDRESLFCDHCEITGHTKENCFKIHGFPPNWNRGGRRGGGGRRGRGRSNGNGRGYNSANNAVGSTENSQPKPRNSEEANKDDSSSLGLQPVLSQQQYQQIMEIIGSMKMDGSATNSNPASTNIVNANTTSGKKNWVDKWDW